MNYNIIKNKKGYIALMTMVILTSLVLIIVTALTNIVISRRQMSKNLVYSAQSYYSAESGLEDSLMRVLNAYDYVASNSFSLDGALMEESITQSGDVTTIESDANYLSNERKVRTYLTITEDGIAFHYGVQVGRGGLTMGNTSQIIGNVYSDGTITGNPGTEITGDVFVATGMSQDHIWSVYNSDGIFGKDDPVIDVAQSFKPSTSGILSQISLYIKKDGNPSDKTIRIFTDNGAALPNAGSPTKTELASDTLVTSKIGSSYGWVDFSFSSPATLTAGTWYWIVIDTSENNSKYFTIGKDSNKGNGNGVSKYSPDWNAASPVWTEDTGDFDFKTWMGGLATSLNSMEVGGSAHAHTINNSQITQDAYYQVISSSAVGGTSYPGSPDPAMEALPISDSNIADWEADAVEYGILDPSICTQSTDITINGGILECDFTPDAINITLNGTLWVKGNITLDVGTHISLGSGYGTRSGIIIADDPLNRSVKGKIVTENLVVICGSQGIDGSTCYPSNGSYILMLSTHSGAADYAIDVRNNTNGAIFYAHNGIAHINNGANLKEVTAYQLDIAPTAIVTYESGLASASFTSGPGAGWRITGWNEYQ